jgi:hypothetical protein
MKLEAPLLNLVTRCQTICEAECCGIHAYDFSPIHIASYLIMYRGKIDKEEISELNNQLEALKVNYGSSGASAKGVTIDEMNQGFSGEEINSLAEEILENLVVAIHLAEVSENERYKNA